MKIVHLSDLHLGKKLKDFSLHEDQEFILRKILSVIDNETPDCIIIAGDIYDKSIPSSEYDEIIKSSMLFKHILCLLLTSILFLPRISYK